VCVCVECIACKWHNGLNEFVVNFQTVDFRYFCKYQLKLLCWLGCALGWSESL
jgi:hypothetical protein